MIINQIMSDINKLERDRDKIKDKLDKLNILSIKEKLEFIKKNIKPEWKWDPCLSYLYILKNFVHTKENNQFILELVELFYYKYGFEKGKRYAEEKTKNIVEYIGSHTYNKDEYYGKINFATLKSHYQDLKKLDFQGFGINFNFKPIIIVLNFIPRIGYRITHCIDSVEKIAGNEKLNKFLKFTENSNSPYLFLYFKKDQYLHINDIIKNPK